MHAEHFRGNGFIISPTGQSVPVSNFKPLPRKKKKNLHFLTGAVSKLFSNCAQQTYTFTRLFSAKICSVAIALCCITVFFNFFTFGTAIYHNGKQIAVSENEASYLSALSSAQAFAEKKAVSTVDFNFSTLPAITLKSHMSSNKNLRNKLLLCSGELSRGCTVYSGDTPVFTAENLSVAKEIVAKHIADFSMNGVADISTNLRYKTTIVKNSSISNAEQCAALLAQNNDISVVSVVNTTSQKAIPFETHTQTDSDLFVGETVTVAEGKAGTVEISSETIYENGYEKTSRILTEKVISKPVAAVVRVGTKPKDVLASGLFHPLNKGVVSSPFGKRWGRMHEGIDIAVKEGTPVYSAEYGTVIYAGDAGSYGTLVRIDHGCGVVTAYAHLSKLQVNVGDIVSANSQIALSGNTGRSTGPHLHFEVVKDSVPQNPDLYFKK